MSPRSVTTKDYGDRRTPEDLANQFQRCCCCCSNNSSSNHSSGNPRLMRRGVLLLPLMYRSKLTDWHPDWHLNWWHTHTHRPLSLTSKLDETKPLHVSDLATRQEISRSARAIKKKSQLSGFPKSNDDDRHHFEKRLNDLAQIAQ